jgi:hypothetical protein
VKDLLRDEGPTAFFKGLTPKVRRGCGARDGVLMGLV